LDNKLLKTPRNLFAADMDKWDEFLIERYSLTSSQIVTDVDLCSPGDHYISWFSDVGKLDLA
jgi:hypothetical protein